MMRYDVNKLFLEPGPCEGCQLQLDCKTEEMACRVFASYVLRGTFYPNAVRIPSYSLFNKIFKEDDKNLRNYLKSIKAKEEMGTDDLFD